MRVTSEALGGGRRAVVLMKSHLSFELPEARRDRHALLEQDVVKRVGTEGFQIHLLFVVPELT